MQCRHRGGRGSVRAADVLAGSGFYSWVAVYLTGQRKKSWMTVWANSVRSALGGLLRGPDVDVGLAFVAFAALLIDPVVSHQVKELTPLAAGLALIAALPLVLRRRHPLGVLVTIVPLLLVCLAVFHPDHAAAGIVMLVVFTVGLHGHRARALVVGALMAPVVAAGVLITSTHDNLAAETVAYVALVLGALAAGDAVRARQELVRVLAQEEERERAALAQHRFDEQRLRYAHELHDVVGHALVAINVRAAAAAHLARREQPVSPVAVLEEIASTSAEALGELRAALKGLRSDGGDGDGVPLRPPGAGLADLGDLIAGVKGAGLTVELDMAADLAASSPAIAHAGYRIVQEGLTNVLRHSTASHALVRIGRDDGALLVEVIDDGPARPAVGTGGGHGLLGMRERAAALGGRCETGQVPGGGWRIRAWIPVEQEERWPT
jgi:signal transduction histidine kinase